MHVRAGDVELCFELLGPDDGIPIVLIDGVYQQRSGRGVITIVPVTSNVARVFPFQTLLPAGLTGLPVDSKAQAEQVRSVSVERLGPVVATVPAPLMLELDDALRLHLQL